MHGVPSLFQLNDSCRLEKKEAPVHREEVKARGLRRKKAGKEVTTRTFKSRG